MNSVEREICALTNFRHPNIIRLKGYCLPDNDISRREGAAAAGELQRTNKLYLLYDYAERGGLDSHLRSTELTWPRRINILVEVSPSIAAYSIDLTFICC